MPNNAELNAWGNIVGECFDQVEVVDDYYCNLCDRSLVPLDQTPSFTNLHSLVKKVLMHLKTQHPGSIPVRPTGK